MTTIKNEEQEFPIRLSVLSTEIVRLASNTLLNFCLPLYLSIGLVTAESAGIQILRQTLDLTFPHLIPTLPDSFNALSSLAVAPPITVVPAMSVKFNTFSTHVLIIMSVFH